MPVCKKSQYLNKISSNTIYIGKSDSKYSCPDSSCAELGSPMRPVDTIQEAFSVIRERYSNETPVTLSFSAGSYQSGEEKDDFEVVPTNLVGLICLQGTATLKCNLLFQNVKNLDILNIHLYGNLDIIADGDHKGKIQWKNGLFRGIYKYFVKDNAEQSFTMKKVEQYVDPDLKKVFDNIVSVTDNGIATVIKNQYSLDSPFEGKIDISNRGKLFRRTEKCSFQSGGENIQITENAVMDDKDKDNVIEKYNDVKTTGDFVTLNMTSNATANFERLRNSYKGHLSDGFFWYNESLEENALMKIYAESNHYDLSGLGGFLSFFGKDTSKYIVSIFQESINMSTNDELRPIFKRILNDSCSWEYNSLSNFSVYAPSHFYENIHNNNSRFQCKVNGVKYTIAGYYPTCNDDSIVELDYNNCSTLCDEKIGYHSKTVLNNSSFVSVKRVNTIEKLCNDGKHSIHDLQQNGNSEYKWSEFNTTSDYKLENRFGSDNKPCVYNDDISESSKLSISSKENDVKVVSGKNCNGLCNANLKDKSESSKSCSNSNIEMILEDDDAVGENVEMMQNAFRIMNEDNQNITQMGGTIRKQVLNDGSRSEFNSNQQSIKHQCHENGTTIDVVLNQNAEHSVVESFSNIESGGTFLNMVTNDNSKTSLNVRGTKASVKGKLSKRQSNDNSVQQVSVFDSEMSTMSQELYEIVGNGKTDYCFNNCQTKGNILAEKVSNLDIQNTSMKGHLHAVQCDKVESNNSSHRAMNDQESPLILENTTLCNIESSKIESLCSTPQIQTRNDEGEAKSTIKCRGVNFVDCPTTGEVEFAACIQKDGKGETVCTVSSCSSQRPQYLSVNSDEIASSVTTVFSRNNDFEQNGLDPTAAGQVIETSNSVLSQNGALISTPEDNCSGTDNEGIMTIPMDITNSPSLTLYYCLALPAYQNEYFVSSAISFIDLIDSYQSKEKAKGIFNVTSTRCLTDKNCSPIDGMYITIQGIRTPNDTNALQTDRDGNIIDRNLKDSLYLEKYHITKIDPVTKITVADIGGSLQYTDGNGGGSTTCIPRLIFPIHYASGEWKYLRDGYIEWNYNNTKETNYLRELRFFSAK